MTTINLVRGLRWALLLLALQTFLAGGSYLTACAFYERLECGVQTGVRWTLAHPVFSDTIWMVPAAGFLVGTFGGLLAAMIPAGLKRLISRRSELLVWAFVILLIAAFALWGLPDALYFLRS